MERAMALADEALQLAESAGDGRSASIAECEAAVIGAEMEIRAAAVDGPEKQRLRTWVKERKAKVAELKRTALLARTGGAQRPGSGAEGAAKRQQQVTQRMHAQTDTLAEARRTMKETEDSAMGIMLDLSAQRETIRSAAAKVEQTSSDLGYASQLLTSMKSWWKLGSIQDKDKPSR